MVNPAAQEAAHNIFTDAAQAVRNVYNDMEVNFANNITVVYDGTWLIRGHSSHIGVGCVIVLYWTCAGLCRAVELLPRMQTRAS